MESIIKCMPGSLKPWVRDMSAGNIASILTMVGSATLYMDDKKQELANQEECSNNPVQPVVASANIGLEGEQEVRNILQERYSIIDTAKSGKCGDFIITVNGTRILVEVKKYSKTVPSMEIEKFYRDIDSNSSVGGAIMISLTSKIVGFNRAMEYTHQYVNGNMVPVIFLSLKGVANQVVAKECVCSAVDILLVESESKNKCVDIGEGIVHAVNDIDRNLDFLSQCRLMIHETQSMFNKQLGKLMQQVLSAEINIKNSIEVLKSKVDVIDIEDTHGHSIKNILSNLKIGLDEDKYNMLSKLLDGRIVTISKTGNVIQTKDNNISIKVTKSTVKVSIVTKLTKSLEIDEPWSYNGKVVTIALTEKTLQTIMCMI